MGRPDRPATALSGTTGRRVTPVAVCQGAARGEQRAVLGGDQRADREHLGPVRERPPRRASRSRRVAQLVAQAQHVGADVADVRPRPRAGARNMPPKRSRKLCTWSAMPASSATVARRSAGASAARRRVVCDAVEERWAEEPSGAQERRVDQQPPLDAGPGRRRAGCRAPPPRRPGRPARRRRSREARRRVGHPRVTPVGHLADHGEGAVPRGVGVGGVARPQRERVAGGLRRVVDLGAAAAR